MDERYILLVASDPTDDGACERALREVLSHRAVVVLPSAGEALRYLLPDRSDEPPPPAAVVLDVDALRGDGLELLDELRRRVETRLVPVVVLSSSGAIGEIRECYRRGANSFVLKPDDARRRGEVVAALGRYWVRLNHPPPAPSIAR